MSNVVSTPQGPTTLVVQQVQGTTGAQGTAGTNAPPTGTGFVYVVGGVQQAAAVPAVSNDYASIYGGGNFTFPNATYTEWVATGGSWAVQVAAAGSMTTAVAYGRLIAGVTGKYLVTASLNYTVSGSPTTGWPALILNGAPIPGGSLSGAVYKGDALGNVSLSLQAIVAMNATDHVSIGVTSDGNQYIVGAARNSANVLTAVRLA